MKVDVTKVLRAIKVLPEDDGVLKGPGDKPITLRQVCLSALVSMGPRCPRCGTVQFPADTQDGEVKFKRWMLAQRIESAKKYIELSNDEVTMLKTTVANNQSTIVCGQVWEMLDPAKVKQHKETDGDE